MDSSESSEVKEHRFSFQAIIWTFVILSVLAGGQALILASYVHLPALPWQFVAGMTGYWLIVASVYATVGFFQVRNRFEKPLQRFQEATRQVSQGDFDVYLEPGHASGTHDWNSLDQMFSDFNMMVGELGSIETMKNDFVANVSHEIKNPLAIIENYAQVLRKTDLTDERRSEYAGIIVSASQRLNVLVTNTLKLNKLESQGIVDAAEDYDLPRQLTDAVLALVDLFEAKNIELDCKVEDRALVHADPGILDIVWANVLGNALKYTDSGGHVLLTQTSDDRTITVEIADDGCGMSAEEVNRVFDKFYQGNTTHAAEGNGLGMAMVKRAIQLSKGTVTIRSAQGVGTTVTIKLAAVL